MKDTKVTKNIEKVDKWKKYSHTNGTGICPECGSKHYTHCRVIQPWSTNDLKKISYIYKCGNCKPEYWEEWKATYVRTKGEYLESEIKLPKKVVAGIKE